MQSQKGEKLGTNIEAKTTLLLEQVLLQPPTHIGDYARAYYLDKWY